MDLHDFDAISLYFDDDCPPAVAALLDTAARACVEGEGELPLLQAYLCAPEQLAVLVGLYRFYFYKHRLPEADLVARRAMSVSGRRLDLPDDWQQMDPIPLAAAASRSMGLLRFWLLALKARAVLALREGRTGEGTRMLEKLACLDQQDRLGASSLLALIGSASAITTLESP